MTELDRSDKQKMVEHAAEKARRSFLFYCHYTDKSFQSPAHLRLLCDELQKVESGETENLMIFMPPRHGKSETTSRKFPAYYLGKHPDHSVILASYAQNLSRGFSRHVRDGIESRLYKSIFNVSTSPDQRSVNDWNIAGKRGGLLAAGVGGAVTGFGAHLFIIDDPVKNLVEAESALTREKIWDWYRSVVLTRMEPGGKKVLIMTRWNRDDLAGRILREMEEEGDLDEWKILNMCAKIETKEQAKQDPMGRSVGEVLWADRYGEKKVEKVKTRVGSRVWSALYQQNPQDPESQKCKREWVQWYDEKDLPPASELVWGGGIDTATSKATHADNMAFAELARHVVDGKIFIDEMFCEKVSVRAFARHVVARHAVRKFRAIKIESNNAGEAILQRVVEEGNAEGIYPPIEAEATSTDKMIRFLEWQHLIENGTIRFRRGNKKVADFVEHLINFDGTGSDIDDDVDACGFALKSIQAETVSSLQVVGWNVR